MNNETSRTHITAEDLSGVCGMDVDLFNSMFPSGAEINAHNIDLCLAAGFERWRFARLIPRVALGKFNKSTATALVEYKKATDAALVAALTYDSVETAL